MLPPAPDFYDSAAAAAEWELCAPVIAGRAAMRVMVRRAGRVAYPETAQRPLTLTATTTPAAVMLWDTTGRLPVLALDFDAKNGHSPREAASHAHTAQALLREAGLHPWADRGPTGGWHVYARLPRPIAAHEVRHVAAALAIRLPSLDITPLTNPLHGCIRTPGSPHKSGGYQRLTQPLDEVQALLAVAPAQDAWTRLVAVVAADQQPIATPPPTGVDPRPAVGVQRRRLATDAEQLATTGRHPTRTFKSPSEARFSVICHAVNAGMGLADIEQALQSRWTWLKTSYGTKHRTALARDFTKAKRNRREAVVHRHVRISDTSHHYPQRGASQPAHLDVHGALRRFTTYCQEHSRRNGYSPTQRAVLNAVIWAGHVQGRIFVNTGVRALAEQSALHYDTVAETLHILASAGLIHRVSSAMGQDADVWRINVELGVGWAMARGRRVGLRRVFRVLGGHLVGEVYETLRDQPAHSPTSCGELATRLGYDRRRVQEALLLLAGWNLADKQDGKWRVGTADVDELGLALGGYEDWQTQHDHHLEQRARWRSRLRRRDSRACPTPGQISWKLEFAVVEPQEKWIEDLAGGSPPRRRGDQQVAMGLVQTVLGGVVVA